MQCRTGLPRPATFILLQQQPRDCRTVTGCVRQSSCTHALLSKGITNHVASRSRTMWGSVYSSHRPPAHSVRCLQLSAAPSGMLQNTLLRYGMRSWCVSSGVQLRGRHGQRPRHVCGTARSRRPAPGKPLPPVQWCHLQCSFRTAQSFPARSQAKQGRSVPVLVLRQGQLLSVTVMPVPWSGRGLLGCLLRPL
jgi:hypothetical protein